MIRFSVIITTYNRKKQLEKAVKSVIDQTYPYYEIIIVDDASSEPHLISKKNHRQDNVRVVRHKSSQGVSAARNMGIEQARFRYLVFLNDNNEFHPEYLEEMVRLLETWPDLDFAWCGRRSRIFDSTSCVEEKESIYSANSYMDVDPCPMLAYWTNSPGVMIRKKVFNRIGLFDTTLTTAEDPDLLLRMLDAGMQFAAVPKVLISVNSYPADRSRRDASRKEADNLTRMIQKNQAFLNRHRHAWAYYMKSLVVACYRAKNSADARRRLFELILKRPSALPLGLRALEYEIKNLLNQS